MRSTLNRIAIDQQILIEVGEDLLPIDRLIEFEGLKGCEEVHIRGFFNESRKEIQIENIQRGIICPGQGYLVNCINQLLEDKPVAGSIFLANVEHNKTLNLLKEAHKSGRSLACLSENDRKPLISSLEKCGFRDLEVVLENTFYYGVRGYRRKLP